MRHSAVFVLALQAVVACASPPPTPDSADKDLDGKDLQVTGLAVKKAPLPGDLIPLLEPWIKRDLYQVRATQNPDFNGTVEVVEATNERSQTRISLRKKGEVFQESVLEAQYKDGRVERFRLLERADNEDLEFNGVMEDGILEVQFRDERIEIPWSEDRRFDGPLPRDFLNTGMKPGRSFSLEIYDPSWDRNRCLTRTYIIGRKAVFQTPLGETLPVHQVEVNVPGSDGDPRLHLLLVDDTGRIVRRTQLPSRASLNINAIVISLLESTKRS